MKNPQLFLSGLLSALFCLLSLLPATAQTPGEFVTDTEWPGIQFQVVRLDRIFHDRLLLVVRIHATNKTPPAGVLLGIPASVTFKIKTAGDWGQYAPKPFSLATSKMTEEQSGASYPVLPTIEPPDKVYFFSGSSALLHRGQSELLSVQFAVPPPPTDPKAPPQTLAFLLPKAKGPMAHVPLPPLPANGKMP